MSVELRWKGLDKINVDDGERTMVWVKGSREREKASCQRVAEILTRRPWVAGEVVITETNSQEDLGGVDIYADVREDVLSVLGIKGINEGKLPFQIKSAAKAARSFLRHKRMISWDHQLSFKEDSYIIAVNGTDAKEMILADLVGQMIILAKRAGLVRTEREFLKLLKNKWGDSEAVKVWREQKNVLLDFIWYRGYF